MIIIVLRGFVMSYPVSSIVNTAVLLPQSVRPETSIKDLEVNEFEDESEVESDIFLLQKNSFTSSHKKKHHNNKNSFAEEHFYEELEETNLFNKKNDKKEEDPQIGALRALAASRFG